MGYTFLRYYIIHILYRILEEEEKNLFPVGKYNINTQNPYKHTATIGRSGLYVPQPRIPLDGWTLLY